MDDTGKLISSRSPATEMKASAGGSGGNKSGPTGSQRDYKKSGQTQKSPSMDGKSFNPMNDGKSTFGVGGV